ncbi:MULTISPECIES: FtsX-like permease family protein [unclassified Mycolicibacterium]|uniref:FtsX-like permease family protein n=1 Tax=unclassified Mycolicibacterium TaxID=2636767 RepID=UPI0012DDD7F0|nr:MULTISPECIES: FtsX-like permease family protein [unclassified Mycolicibacterium]MUL85235.1 FtsX-like permease family protein [Mycolicibacterium sp. CBMA 329]MUL91202.1 FtsX-like permease family protein [Mycolicibacterium sp. CBMA 331]MUL98129.1 FtsX-like permease family protein [Mycolicibacterium sp. CBMA 334]MUM25771.1 FtsX-like permease family protein [Mycolicibacterium sp. CBMA 295]MUM40961.1 FtsX-like permease family protein [Mycolicibacterium sp. CBMA 247]
MAAAASRLRVFSLRELTVHRRRTIASIAVMAVSAMYLVAIFGIFGSITGSVNRLADGIAGVAALEVSGITDAGFPDSVLTDVTKVPGVATAAPMIRMSAPTATEPVLLFGADDRSRALEGALKDAVGVQVAAPSAAADGVRVGPGVGHAKGETFQLGSGSVTVTEVLEGKQLADLNGGHYVLAPLPLAQNVTGRQGQLDSILITTTPDADLNQVREQVTSAVNGRAIVAAPSLRAARAGDGVKLMNYMALMGAAVALVVGAFLIYTTMTMAIAQRRPVISMLRAIGGRRVTIVRDMLAEAAILGLIGGTIGSLLGIALGRMAIGRLPPTVTQGLEARIEYWLPSYAIPVAVVATALTSVAASAMAARQVYKVSPIEALAPVGVSAADNVPRWLRITSGVGAVAVLAASILIVFYRPGSLAFVAIAALFTAQIALGFALAGPIVKTTAAVARVFGSAGALAAATVERAPRRVWATVMTVLIAVVTTVVITGTNNDMIRSAGDVFAPVADVDVWVSANSPDQYPTDVLPQGLSQTVAGVTGVADVTEGALGFAVVGGTRVMLDGFAPGTHDALFRALDDQVRSEVLAGRGVVLSQNLGKTLGVRTGDDLQLQTPHGPQRTTVLALVPYFSTVIGTVGMGLDQMRAWFDRPGATTLQVTAADGADPNRLLTDVRAAVPAPNYTYDGRTALAGLEAPLHQSMLIANAVWIIVVFVAAVALLNTLTLSVLERRREIGVLRAMGSSRRYTLAMILAEAAAIGIVGGVLGLLVGLVDQWLFSLVSGDIMNFDVTFRPSPMAVVFTLGALVISLLGSLPPARRAARLNIIEAVSVE